MRSAIDEPMSKVDSNADVKRGLEGVIVAESRVCYIDGIKGRLYYRGYGIGDIAKNCSFEEAAYLLLYSKLPNRRALHSFSVELRRRRNLPQRIVEMMRTFSKSMTSMEALRTAVSALAADDPDARKVSLEDHLNNGISLIAKMPTIVAYYYRINRGEEVVKPDPELGHAANFLYMMTGRVPDKTSARGMDMDMVLHAEHGFNASSFAVRVTVSTLSDMHSAFTTGVGTLKGPLHGGAAEEVMRMLEEIGYAKNVDKYVQKILAGHGRVMGYGHRIYKTYDPRARVLKKMAEEMSKEKENMRWFEIGERLEVVMEREKGLYPNVDFYSAMVYHHLALPIDINPSLFAIARSAGWVAHAAEQYGDNKLIRPLDRYVGEIDLEFIPLNKRK
ncbi:MAG: citrate synthase [Candidatus Micrarchaeota archaeon]|nr:citrate synthase [Candidatus Micrarchaeota archaeon]MDE1864437.1 citrate synthase [Candidatus Micrarchaeota archaeon]